MKKKDTRFRYTEKQKQFIIDNVAGKSYDELTRLFNRRFKMSKTLSMIKTFCTVRGLCNGFGNAHGNPNYKPAKKYNDTHIRFLEKNVTDRSYAELTELFNKKFGFSISIDAMSTLLGRYKITNGRDCRIKHGNVPPNKGRKGYCAPGSEKGWFKPGHIPAGTMPIGSERINACGYVEVKYSENSGKPSRRWKGKHVMIWEKANGHVPRGHVVIFADGDKRNFKLSNLVLVSRSELAVLNRSKLLSNKEDETKTALALAAMKIAIEKRKGQTFTGIKKRKMVFVDGTGKKLYVCRIAGSGNWAAMRENKNGMRRMQLRTTKPRESFEEAQKDLYEYARKRKWRVL